jgi:hypothetical protein
MGSYSSIRYSWRINHSAVLYLKKSSKKNQTGNGSRGYYQKDTGLGARKKQNRASWST